MQEMSDSEAPGESGAGSSSRSVSFPDHYLVPYIQMCKRSKPITCGCSLIFIGLATYFFFATSYKILFNYPITVSRKVACVFGGICCLLAAFRCLDLRFKCTRECRAELDNDTLFEIVQRNTELSDSFSGRFEMQEMPLRHGTPNEGPSRTGGPSDSASRAQSINDPCFPDTSKVRNGGAHLPRHSISGGLTPDIPLLPQGRPLKFSRPSWMKSWIDSKRLLKDAIVSDKYKYPLNYSTFDPNCEVSDTEPLLAKSTFDNCEESDTEPLLAKSRFDNCEESDTEPLLAKSTFDNCEESDTEQLLAKSTFDNCEESNTEPLLAKSTFNNDGVVSNPLLAKSICGIGFDVPGTEPVLAKSTFGKGCESFNTESLLAKSTCRNGSDATETETLLSTSTCRNGSYATETEPLISTSTCRNGSYATETEPLLAESMIKNGQEAPETAG